MTMSKFPIAALFLAASVVGTSRAEQQRQIRVPTSNKKTTTKQNDDHQEENHRNLQGCPSRGGDCSYSRCCSDGSTCTWSGLNGSDRYYCTANVVSPVMVWDHDGHDPTPPPIWKDDGHNTDVSMVKNALVVQ